MTGAAMAATTARAVEVPRDDYAPVKGIGKIKLKETPAERQTRLVDAEQRRRAAEERKIARANGVHVGNGAGGAGGRYFSQGPRAPSAQTRTPEGHSEAEVEAMEARKGAGGRMFPFRRMRMPGEGDGSEAGRKDNGMAAVGDGGAREGSRSRSAGDGDAEKRGVRPGKRATPPRSRVDVYDLERDSDAETSEIGIGIGIEPGRVQRPVWEDDSDSDGGGFQYLGASSSASGSGRERRDPAAGHERGSRRPSIPSSSVSRDSPIPVAGPSSNPERVRLRERRDATNEKDDAGDITEPAPEPEPSRKRRRHSPPAPTTATANGHRPRPAPTPTSSYRPAYTHQHPHQHRAAAERRPEPGYAAAEARREAAEHMADIIDNNARRVNPVHAGAEEDVRIPQRYRNAAGMGYGPRHGHGHGHGPAGNHAHASGSSTHWSYTATFTSSSTSGSASAGHTSHASHHPYGSFNASAAGPDPPLGRMTDDEYTAALRAASARAARGLSAAQARAEAAEYVEKERERAVWLEKERKRAERKAWEKEKRARERMRERIEQEMRAARDARGREGEGSDDEDEDGDGVWVDDAPPPPRTASKGAQRDRWRRRWEGLRRGLDEKTGAGIGPSRGVNVAGPVDAAQGDAEVGLEEIEMAFGDIPWPIYAPAPAAHARARAGGVTQMSVEDLTAERIKEFLLGVSGDAAAAAGGAGAGAGAAGGASGASYKRTIKETIRHFHPDRFTARLLPRVRASERERVREGVEVVVRVLNGLYAAA